MSTHSHFCQSFDWAGLGMVCDELWLTVAKLPIVAAPLVAGPPAANADPPLAVPPLAVAAPVFIAAVAPPLPPLAVPPFAEALACCCELSVAVPAAPPPAIWPVPSVPPFPPGPLAPEVADGSPPRSELAFP